MGKPVILEERRASGGVTVSGLDGEAVVEWFPPGDWLGGIKDATEPFDLWLTELWVLDEDELVTPTIRPVLFAVAFSLPPLISPGEQHIL